MREKLRKHPIIGIILGVALIGFGLWMTYRYSAGPSVAAGPPQNIFLSTDDGKTYFVAPGDPLPPVIRDGKSAVRAYVFRCGDQPFVGYLERYSDRAKQLMREMWTEQQANGGPPSINTELLSGIEVKRPGETTWVTHADLTRASAIMDVRCPDDPERRAAIVQP